MVTVDGTGVDRAWAARAELTGVELPPARAAGKGLDYVVIDLDATLVQSHSEKENAAATWKRTFGFHPLLCFLDRPEVASGEALAALLRPGNAGSVRHEVAHGELVASIGGRLMSTM